LRHGRRIKPALAASLLGDHLEPVPFVGDERMMVEEAEAGRTGRHVSAQKEALTWSFSKTRCCG
jgi:hypothetical protein